MSSFEVAWDSIAKAPWILDDGIFFDETNPRNQVEGPIYSGGDSWDEPRYWTKDFNEALAYALFGSAIPVSGLEDSFREQVPMRETIPTIRIAQDPGYGWRNEKGEMKAPNEFDDDDDINNYLLQRDPESEGYLIDEQWGAPEHKEMEEKEMRKLLLSLIEGHDDMFAWGTSGAYKTADERKAHIRGALDRLMTNTRGNIYLADEHKKFSQTSETDGIEASDDEEYLREWGRWNE